MRQIADLESGDDKPAKANPAAQDAAASSYAIPGDKEKAILAPEEVFFEGPPSWTEMVLPGISILTVIGIVPFIATATRQAWVKYKVTSRRISVTSGFNGQVRRSWERDRRPCTLLLLLASYAPPRALSCHSSTAPCRRQDLTEITYDEIYNMKFVYRSFGSVGDVVIELRDGAKLEMRSVPEFDDVYAYIFERTNAECQEYSDKTRTMKEATTSE